MKPVRIIRSFADLAAAVAAVRAESGVVDPKPMTPDEVQQAARAFVAYRRNAASGPAPSPNDVPLVLSATRERRAADQ
jgi:hypothetical protein